MIIKKKGGKMMKTLFNRQMMKMRLQTGQLLSKLMEEEKGDTNFVAIIILIVIIIGIATIFRDKLTDAVNNVMGQLTDFIG